MKDEIFQLHQFIASNYMSDMNLKGRYMKLENKHGDFVTNYLGNYQQIQQSKFIADRAKRLAHMAVREENEASKRNFQKQFGSILSRAEDGEGAEPALHQPSSRNLSLPQFKSESSLPLVIASNPISVTRQLLSGENRSLVDMR